MGVLADSVAPDVAMPMVAADDIAAVAAKALIERDWSGIAVQELLGPRDLSQVVARILGERIGQPDLPYVHLGDAAPLLSSSAGFSCRCASRLSHVHRAPGA